MVRLPQVCLLFAAIALAVVGLSPVAAQEGDAPTIDDPRGSMAHFYRRLRQVQGRQRGTIARVSVYGESTNAADRVTSALRRAMARRFGDAGKGFVPISPGWPYQRHRDVEWRQEGNWRTWVVNRNNGPLSRYGLGGVLTQNRTPRDRAYFGTVSDGPVNRRVARYQLFYQAFPEGGDLALKVDDGAAQRISTRAGSVQDRIFDLPVQAGAHTLEIAPVEGDVRLYGVVMEGTGPGTVVDGLMLVGAFTRVLLQFDASHWQRQIALRQPDLLVFWLGGNDATSRTTGFGNDRYVRQYSEAIGRARRGRPEASCLVVSVIDSAESVDGRLRTLPRIPRVVEAQRQTATQTGCAFLDLFEATGGRGTMARWRRRGLAEGDYKHLTQAGAREVGETIFEALMEGF